jgi:hypothetical protein
MLTALTLAVLTQIEWYHLAPVAGACTQAIDPQPVVQPADTALLNKPVVSPLN